MLRDAIISGDMHSLYGSQHHWDMLKGSSFYITGASGMIASYIVYFLVFLNEVHGYDIKIFANVRSFAKAQKRFGEYIQKGYFNLIVSDVNDAVSLDSPVDYIIHAASLASPQFYGRFPVETILPNVIGTNELLKYCIANPVKGFLFFSSGSVYGDTMSEIIDEETIGVLDYLAPGNCYGEGKRCGEALCIAYHREYSIPTRIARISHTYGPTMDIDEDQRVFSEFVKNAVNGEDIEIKSAGTARRPFCYITDTVSALFRILLQGDDGRAYNVGNPKEFYSIKELADLLVDICENRIKVIMGTRTVGINYQPSNVTVRTIPSVERLEQLGWSAQISARTGFARCIEHFRKSQRGVV